MTTNYAPTLSTAIALLAYERTVEWLANPAQQDDKAGCDCNPQASVERLWYAAMPPHEDGSPCESPALAEACCMVLEIVEGVVAALNRADAEHTRAEGE